VYTVVTGTSGTNNNAARFATPTNGLGLQATSQTLSPGVSTPIASAGATYDGDPCSTVHDALTLVLLLKHQNFPVSHVFVSAQEPSQAAPCSAVTFQDQRGRGSEELAVYRTSADATAAARAVRGGLPVVVGKVVLTCDESLRSESASYQLALTKLTAPTLPSTAPAPTTRNPTRTSQ